MCHACDPYVNCYECGDRVHSDSAYEYDGQYYCEYCSESNFETCKVCDENSVYVGTEVNCAVVVDDAERTYGHEFCICEQCIRASSINSPYFSTVKIPAKVNNGYWRDGYGYTIHYSAFTEEGLDALAGITLEEIENEDE